MINLILISLVLTAFITKFACEPLLALSGYGVQQTKEIISIMSCLAIILLALYRGKLKRYTNIPFILFVGFLILSPIYFPPFIVVVEGLDEGGFWVYQPILYSLIYALTFICLSCIPITKQDIHKILNTFSWVGVIMSVLVFVQFLNIKPFYAFVDYEYLQWVTNAYLVGTVGNPTWVGAFLILTIPAALYLKKYFKALIIISAVLCLRSQMAIGSMIAGLILYSLRYLNVSYRISVSLLLLIISIVCALVVISPKSIQKYVDTRGRLIAWKDTWKVITGPVNIIKITDDMTKQQKLDYERFNNKKYMMFGYGMGSYEYIITKRINTKFNKLHNEFYEILCNLGIVGITLFISSLLYIFYGLIKDNTILGWTFSVTLFISCLNALGTTTWQVEPSRLFSLITAGLACNYITRGRNDKCCSSQ